MSSYNIDLYLLHNAPEKITISDFELTNDDYRSGIIHRTDGPALCAFNDESEIMYLWYIYMNKFHRTDGPAVIDYRDEKSVVPEYWIDDQYYNKKDYYNLINEMKALPKSLRLTHELWWVREL